MALAWTLLAGGLLGVQHAFETDHLAAVATLVDEDTDRPGLVGASWGIGHTLPIAAVGIAFVLLGFQLPATITRLFELGVAVVLVLLGARLLLDVGCEHRFIHRHGDSEGHTHVRLGEWSLGLTHGHTHEESLAVGILHGLAGSGVVVVAPAVATRSIEPALVFLGGFGLLSVATMTAISVLWGRTLAESRLDRLRAIAGVAGIAVGLSLFVQVGFGITTPL